MNARVTFNEVSIQGNKTVKCARACGQSLKRSLKFWQTLSPFNKNADGKPKTRDEIQGELKAERSKWLTEPEICKRCR